MTDIFEIKTTEVKIKIGKNMFALKDPNFMEKVNLTKDWEALSKQKGELENSEFMKKAWDLNKRMIRSWLPEMTEEFIEKDLSSSAMELLVKKLTELSEEKFGAVIEKVEKK